MDDHVHRGVRVVAGIVGGGGVIAGLEIVGGVGSAVAAGGSRVSPGCGIGGSSRKNI
jgi:hypothetical protein